MARILLNSSQCCVLVFVLGLLYCWLVRVFLPLWCRDIFWRERYGRNEMRLRGILNVFGILIINWQFFSAMLRLRLRQPYNGSRSISKFIINVWLNLYIIRLSLHTNPGVNYIKRGTFYYLIYITIVTLVSVFFVLTYNT